LKNFRRKVAKVYQVRSGDGSEEQEALIEKAENLLHYCYDSSDKKVMLLDIQGSKYNLYNPEIATK